MTRGRVYKRGRIYWISYHYKGREYRESSGSDNRENASGLLAKRLGEIGANILGQAWTASCSTTR
jgi:hypothetical protein